MSVHLHGHHYRVYVRRSDGRWQRVTTGVGDKKTANRIEAMVKSLADRREWTFLDAVCAGRLPLGRLFDAYRDDPSLRRFALEVDDIDLEPFVGRWLEYLRARGTVSAERYVHQVRQLAPKCAAFPRSRFTEKAIADHLTALPVSGSTKIRHRAALMGFAKYLREQGALTVNPVREVRRAKANAPRMRFLEAGEVELLIGALAYPFKALEALMASTGLEWQVSARLTRRDIDLAAGTVRAHGSKSAYRDRTVRIVLPWAVPILEQHLRGLMPSAPVFPVRHHAALAAHHAACKAVGIAYCTLHDWRHTAAVQMLRDGLGATVVAAQLGHSNAYLTFTVYGKFAPAPADYLTPMRRVQEAK
jgi:integrase